MDKKPKETVEESRTHITFLIDRSGSMRSVWDDVQGGYATLIEENQKLEDKCTMSLIGFDAQYESSYFFKKIGKVDGLLPFKPRGSTALLDAMGRAITSTREEIEGLKESKKPNKVLMVIQTDGFENASREYNSESVKSLISECKALGWDFMFLGAGEEFLEIAKEVGISKGTMSSYNSNSRAYANVTDKVKKYRGSNIAARSATLDFSDADRAELNKV